MIQTGDWHKTLEAGLSLTCQCESHYINKRRFREVSVPRGSLEVAKQTWTLICPSPRSVFFPVCHTHSHTIWIAYQKLNKRKRKQRLLKRMSQWSPWPRTIVICCQGKIRVKSIRFLKAADANTAISQLLSPTQIVSRYDRSTRAREIGWLYEIFPWRKSKHMNFPRQSNPKVTVLHIPKTDFG